jgi:anti-anti-sigma regulatory factor
MDLNEHCDEKKSPPCPSVMYALRFLTQNPAEDCESGSALIQCVGRLDRRTYPQLSQMIENAISKDCRTIIFDFSCCSYDERVLADLVDLALAMGITAITTAAISKLADIGAVQVLRI